MSELSSKLQAPAKGTGTKPRATLKQLLSMWGRLELIHRETMEDDPEVWIHISGSGQEAIFEKQDDT